jgi:chromosome segregation ATPase
MKDNARAALKAAKAEVKKLTEEVAKLEESLARSREMAEEATGAIEAFSKLDNEISRYRAEAVKSDHDPRALPAALKSKVNARAQAQEELKQAEETRDVLEVELKAAQAQLARLNSQLIGHASNVLREFADGLAAELFAVSKRYWELQHILSGLDALQYFDPELKRRVSVGDSEAIGTALRGYSPGQ